MSLALFITIIGSTLRLATPILFAGLGGLVSEKSGVTNIGLEGMMTIGAFFSVIGTHYTGNPYFGVLCGAVMGGAIALIHAVLSIHLRANQVISGTAINLFSLAFASFLMQVLFNKGGQTDMVAKLPFSVPSFIGNIPFIGPLLKEINWFVIVGIILAFVISFILNKTALGLRIRSVGEYPKAADTLGVNVFKLRYLCVILSGVLAGIGGAALTLGSTPIYREGMISGRGFIGLAALIFGNWNPFGVLGASALFGFADTLQLRVQGSTLLGIKIPTEFFTMLPYILTMVVLAGFMGKSRPPAASGTPYEKGER